MTPWLVFISILAAFIARRERQLMALSLCFAGIYAVSWVFFMAFPSKVLGGDWYRVCVVLEAAIVLCCFLCRTNRWAASTSVGCLALTNMTINAFIFVDYQNGVISWLMLNQFILINVSQALQCAALLIFSPPFTDAILGAINKITTKEDSQWQARQRQPVHR